MKKLGPVCVLVITFLAPVGFAQLTREDIAALQSQGKALGWTFVVGETVATQRPIDQLCGLVVPDGWWVGARFNPFNAKADLPPAFDWRANGGCTPIKNQGGCGSCWAFGTVGALECSIKIKDNQTVILSEQWLVSCNQETEAPHLLGGTWGCQGGWWAHDYHAGIKTDPCGGAGAVLSANFPYSAYDQPCRCPYQHDYAMNSWGYIGEMEGIPEVSAIKEAILTYGPVSAAVYVNSAFGLYKGGIFNASANQEVNHAVVLVGWDDNQGANGVWILRNSWGSTWGESGYMRIEYGCSNVGYGACYVDYAGKGAGVGPAITREPDDGVVPLRWQHVFTVDARGIGTLHYHWEHNGNAVGTDAPVLAVENVSYDDEGTYTCRVSDVRGTSMSRSATLSINASESVPAPHSIGLLIFMIVCVFRFLRIASPDERPGRK